MAVDIMEGINRLVERMKLMEEDIEKEAELLKQEYLKASNSMPESQNYFLNGIQAASHCKIVLDDKKRNRSIRRGCYTNTHFHR